MDLLEAITTRRSIRSYTDQPVSDDLAQEIIRAGMMVTHFFSARDVKPRRGVALSRALVFSSSAALVSTAQTV